jgi:hypothetical protein
MCHFHQIISIPKAKNEEREDDQIINEEEEREEEEIENEEREENEVESEIQRIVIEIVRVMTREQVIRIIPHFIDSH